MTSPYLLLPIRDLAEACHDRGQARAWEQEGCPRCALHNLCTRISKAVRTEGVWDPREQPPSGRTRCAPL